MVVTMFMFFIEHMFQLAARGSLKFAWIAYPTQAPTYYVVIT